MAMERLMSITERINQVSIYDHRPCPCGSGKPSHWEFDARGIPTARVCPDCREKKLSKFRPEVLTNPNYDLMGETLDED